MNTSSPLLILTRVTLLGGGYGPKFVYNYYGIILRTHLQNINFIHLPDITLMMDVLITATPLWVHCTVLLCTLALTKTLSCEM